MIIRSLKSKRWKKSPSKDSQRRGCAWPPCGWMNTTRASAKKKRRKRRCWLMIILGIDHRLGYWLVGNQSKSGKFIDDGLLMFLVEGWIVRFWGIIVIHHGICFRAGIMEWRLYQGEFRESSPFAHILHHISTCITNIVTFHLTQHESIEEIQWYSWYCCHY